MHLKQPHCRKPYLLTLCCRGGLKSMGTKQNSYRSPWNWLAVEDRSRGAGGLVKPQTDANHGSSGKHKTKTFTNIWGETMLDLNNIGTEQNVTTRRVGWDPKEVLLHYRLDTLARAQDGAHGIDHSLVWETTSTGEPWTIMYNEGGANICIYIYILYILMRHEEPDVVQDGKCI